MFITPLNPHGDTPLDARRECYIPPLPTNSTMTTLPSNALKPSRAPFTNLFAIRASLRHQHSSPLPGVQVPSETRSC